MPFLIGKGSRAALEGVPGEQGGAQREHRGSTEGAQREHRGSRGSTQGAGGARRKEPVLAPRTAAWLSLLLPRLRVSSILCDQRRLLKNKII